MKQCTHNFFFLLLQYFPLYDWVDSAPYKVTTVRDALSDLPTIKSGHNEDVMSYSSEPLSPFQRKVSEPFSTFKHFCILQYAF